MDFRKDRRLAHHADSISVHNFLRCTPSLRLLRRRSCWGASVLTAQTPQRPNTPLHPLRMQNQVQREGFVEFSTDIMEGVAVLLRTAAYLQRSNSVSTVSLGLDGLFG